VVQGLVGLALLERDLREERLQVALHPEQENVKKKGSPWSRADEMGSRALHLAPVQDGGIDGYTIPGYSIDMQHPHARHTGQLERLRRIEGQVGGLVRMVEQERYCVDILTQIRAARAALRRVEEAVLREHVEHCVAQAIRSGDAAEQKAKVDELLDVVGRFSD